MSISGAADRSLIQFDVAGQRFALDVHVTREVVTLDRLVHVPRAPRGTLGLFPLRGAPLCAIDTAALLDEQAVPAPRRSGVIVSRGRAPLCALAVDAVHGVATLKAGQIFAADRARESPMVLGFCTVGDRTLTLLDPTELLHRIDSLRFQ